MVILRRHLFLAILACALIPCAVQAALGRWTRSGPEGGRVVSLAVDPASPATLYAGTDGGGVFKSSDAGMRWSHAGLAGLAVRALLPDSSDPVTIYAGTGGGVFKSTDGANTWKLMNRGLTITSVQVLAIHPRIASTLYAGTSLEPHPGRSGGLFKSVDGGESWTRMSISGSSGPVESIAILPTEADVLYAAFGSYRFTSAQAWRSLDGGSSWTRSSNGLPYPNGRLVLAVDVENPRTLYAGTSRGLYKSTNAGEIWFSSGPGLENIEIRALRTDPTDSAVLYAATSAGIFKSLDAAGSWSRSLESPASSLAIDSASSATLYAGAAEGLVKSTDRGASWMSSQTGLVATSISELFLQADSPGELYARANATVFRSANGGASWEPFSRLPAGAFMRAFAMHPKDTSVQYVGDSCRGILKTTDAGLSWKATSLATGCVDWIFFDPQNPATVFAFGRPDSAKSLDEGSTWSRLDFRESVSAFAVHPWFTRILYAGSYTRGMFRSHDGGVSFTPINTGIPTCAGDGSACRLSITSLAIDPRTPTTLYAGAYDLGTGRAAGLLKTTDGGAVWRQAGRDLPATRAIALAIDPANPAIIYAGTLQGVFRSRDGGETFSPFSEGLTQLSVSSLAIDPSGRFLHVGTNSGGVFDVEVLPDRLPVITPVPRPPRSRAVPRP